MKSEAFKWKEPKSEERQEVEAGSGSSKKEKINELPLLPGVHPTFLHMAGLLIGGWGTWNDL
jgi:hypothetical protein